MKKFVLLLVVVLLVAGAWSGGWLFAANEIRKTVAGLAPTPESGGGVSCGQLEVSGFPFRFDIGCTEATVVSGDLTITVAGIRASILAYNPTHAVFSALAPATVVDAYSGVRNSISFASAAGSARIVTDDMLSGLAGEGWRIGTVSLVAEAIRWTDITVTEAPILEAAHLEAHLVDVPEDHEPDAGSSVLAAYVRLTEAGAPELGIAGGAASIEAELTGVPDDLRVLGEPGLVGRWQAADGRLKLVALKGEAGEEFVESTGTIGLDSGSRLDGRVTIRSKGLVERFGALLPEDWRGLILGGQAEDGSYSQTINVKAGVIFSGIMPIGIIPPLS